MNNNKKSIAKYGWGILLSILALLGILIAGTTYSVNNAIPRGILGAITICLLYYFGRQTKMDVSLEELTRDSQKGKYIISAFFISIISYWSAAQIYEMIAFLTNK